MSTLRVYRIFKSIQGESTYAGLACAFVRLAGCDIGCAWCDTPQAAKDDAGIEMTLDEIAGAVDALTPTGMGGRRGLVEITGGEPLRQSATPALANRLAAHYLTLVETSGVYDIRPLDHPIVRVMDVKCPGSGVLRRMDWKNLERLRPEDEIKFVVSDQADVMFAYDTIWRFGLESRLKPALLSPVWDRLEPRRLAAWMLDYPPVARMQIPLHKVIWPEGEPTG